MQPSWRLQPAPFPTLWPQCPPTSSQSSRASSSWTRKRHPFPARVIQSCFGCAGLLAAIRRVLRESKSNVPRLAIKNYTKSWPQKDVPVAWAWAGAKPGTSKRRREKGGTSSCERLSEIARMYDAFTFDFDEVLEVASKANVLDCLRHLCQMDRKVVLISEHPARSALYMEQLQAQGVDVEALAGIVTSGELLHQYLSLQQKRLGENVLWIAASSDLKAPEDQLDLLEYGYKPEANIDKVDFILCTGGGAVFAATDYQQESAFAKNGEVAPFRPLFRQASSRGLPLLCLGTLDEHIVDGQTYFMPARLASSYKDFDGKVVYFGRPQTAVFDEVLRVLEDAGMDLLEAKVAHVGLCPKRDVAGAVNAGFSSVLLRAEKQTAGNAESEEDSAAPSRSPTIELQSFRW